MSLLSCLIHYKVLKSRCFIDDADGSNIRFYEEGSLLLVARDPQSQKILWQGVARIEVESGMTPVQKENLLKRSVSALLKAFPSEGGH